MRKLAQCAGSDLDQIDQTQCLSCIVCKCSDVLVIKLYACARVLVLCRCATVPNPDPKTSRASTPTKRHSVERK